MEQKNSLDILIERCVESLGISSLCHWDVLVFVHRHQASLVSAEQISLLLGYSSKLVGHALDTLENTGLVKRSRASQGVRLYQLIPSQVHLAPESCFQQLTTPVEKRTGRLLLARRLKQTRAGLHLADKERQHGRRGFD